MQKSVQSEDKYMCIGIYSMYIHTYVCCRPSRLQSVIVTAESNLTAFVVCKAHLRYEYEYLPVTNCNQV